MVSESMMNFAEAIKEGEVERAEELIDEMIKKKGSGGLEELEESIDIDPELVKEIQIHGYNTLSGLANASLEKLMKIPELRDGNAKEVLNSAKKHVEKKFTELPGVGEDTAKKILKNGYVSFRSLAKASAEELSKIPGIGKKGAKKIIEYAKNNPKDKIEDLPGVGKKSTEEIKKHGYTALGRVAESSVEELLKTPNIGEKGAKKILDHAREKMGGKTEDLPKVGKKTAKEMRKHGYPYIKNVAKSSVEELIKIPSLREGKAKRFTAAAKEITQTGGGDTRGYIHALNGMISGLESDHKLTLSQKLAEGKYSEEELKEIKKRMKTKASRQFRPPEERKFNKAWADILTAIIKIEENGDSG